MLSPDLRRGRSGFLRDWPISLTGIDASGNAGHRTIERMKGRCVDATSGKADLAHHHHIYALHPPTQNKYTITSQMVIILLCRSGTVDVCCLRTRNHQRANSKTCQCLLIARPLSQRRSSTAAIRIADRTVLVSFCRYAEGQPVEGVPCRQSRALKHGGCGIEIVVRTRNALFASGTTSFLLILQYGTFFTPLLLAAIKSHCRWSMSKV
ncbi:hypothetical protein BDZ85DRAFT_32763 [Elsinoe ampelina]|uniref:Uncharacterized protein n=1 Tax=Elsinoe ampelina TaxID=302913 RepID=A0A6A6G350_9PEZI|nr:hypothetical protein BDZ85DRAFT_32763 [Elsinoe ampelina]